MPSVSFGKSFDKIEQVSMREDMTEGFVELDLRGEVCPFTFVKTKLQLEGMENGERLTVIFDYAPAVSSVPRSVKSEGHNILGIEKEGERIWKIHIEKKG
jgi:TusA-related sulfurtransferase